MKTIIKLLLYLSAVLILFHSLILLKIVPYEITWGGRLKNDNEMYLFETISIVVILFLCLVLMIKGNFLKDFIPLKIVNIVLWGFAILFALNTLGNLAAKTAFEKYFALVTFLYTFLILKIMITGKKIETDIK